jgi:hypothetical protein
VIVIDERMTLSSLATVLAEADIGVALIRRADDVAIMDRGTIVGVASVRDVMPVLLTAAREQS